MGAAPKRTPDKADKAASASSSSASSASASSPVRTGRDLFAARATTAMTNSPTKLLTAVSKLILVLFYIAAELVCVAVGGQNFGLGISLRDFLTNFGGIAGRLMFWDAIQKLGLSTKQLDFMVEPTGLGVRKAVHMFFYSTAEAQGKAEQFDDIPQQIRDLITNSTDEQNGGRAWSLEEKRVDLEEDDIEALLALSTMVKIP